MSAISPSFSVLSPCASLDTLPQVCVPFRVPICVCVLVWVRVRVRVRVRVLVLSSCRPVVLSVSLSPVLTLLLYCDLSASFHVCLLSSMCAFLSVSCLLVLFASSPVCVYLSLSVFSCVSISVSCSCSASGPSPRPCLLLSLAARQRVRYSDSTRKLTKTNPWNAVVSLCVCPPRRALGRLERTPSERDMMTGAKADPSWHGQRARRADFAYGRDPQTTSGCWVPLYR